MQRLFFENNIFIIMQQKLQELTEKLYNEGVSKANEEAEQIINDAKEKADKMVKEAEEKASQIQKEAESKAKEYQGRIESEVQQASHQSIRALKQEITKLITTKFVESSVDEAFNDKDFVKNIIEIAIKNWDSQSNDPISLSILLPEKEEKALGEYFKEKANELLKGELSVEFDSSMKGGFKIGPKDGSYVISFADEDFQNLFKSYLRPKTAELLFDEE